MVSSRDEVDLRVVQTTREVHDEEGGAWPVRFEDPEQPLEIDACGLALIRAYGEVGVTATSQERFELRFDPVEN
jgi:hypothetical protein